MLSYAILQLKNLKKRALGVTGGGLGARLCPYTPSGTGSAIRAVLGSGNLVLLEGSVEGSYSSRWKDI